MGCMAYADDLVLMAPTKLGLEKMIEVKDTQRNIIWLLMDVKVNS